MKNLLTLFAIAASLGACVPQDHYVAPAPAEGAFGFAAKAAASCAAQGGTYARGGPDAEYSCASYGLAAR